MRLALQKLRDEAEKQCQLAAEQNDRDSAEAWDRIFLALDDVQKAIRFDFRIVEERRGLFSR